MNPVSILQRASTPFGPKVIRSILHSSGSRTLIFFEGLTGTTSCPGEARDFRLDLGASAFVSSDMRERRYEYEGVDSAVRFLLYSIHLTRNSGTSLP